MKRLVAAVDRLIAFFTRVQIPGEDERGWARPLAEIRDELLDPSLCAAALNKLGECFGGMGSLNDYMFHPQNNNIGDGCSFAIGGTTACTERVCSQIPVKPSGDADKFHVLSVAPFRITPYRYHTKFKVEDAKWSGAHASACASNQHACPRSQHRVTSRMPDVGCRPPVCCWSSTAVASLAPQTDRQVIADQGEGSIRNSAPSSSSVRR